jgi:hypothetical protein
VRGVRRVVDSSEAAAHGTAFVVEALVTLPESLGLVAATRSLAASGAPLGAAPTPAITDSAQPLDHLVTSPAVCQPYGAQPPAVNSPIDNRAAGRATANTDGSEICADG